MSSASSSSSSATTTWEALLPMGTQRKACAAAAVEAYRKIVVVGGHDGQNRLASAECYDMDTHVWTELPPMNTPRSGCAAAAISVKREESDQDILGFGAYNAEEEYNVRIVVVGGRSDTEKSLNTAEYYDFSTNTWTTMSAPMNMKRWGCAATSMLDGSVLAVVGGVDENDARLATVETYDFASNQWALLPRCMTAVRSFCGAVSVGRRLVVLGGFVGNDRVVNKVESYDVDLQQWSSTALPPMTENRTAFAVATVGNSIVVVGGNKGSKATAECLDGPFVVDSGGGGGGGGRRRHAAATSSGDASSTATLGSWKPMPGISSGTAGGAAVSFHDRIVVLGGASLTNQVQADARQFVFTHTMSLLYPNSWSAHLPQVDLPSLPPSPLPHAAAAALAAPSPTESEGESGGASLPSTLESDMPLLPPRTGNATKSRKQQQQLAQEWCKDVTTKLNEVREGSLNMYSTLIHSRDDAIRRHDHERQCRLQLVNRQMAEMERQKRSIQQDYQERVHQEKTAVEARVRHVQDWVTNASHRLESVQTDMRRMIAVTATAAAAEQHHRRLQQQPQTSEMQPQPGGPPRARASSRDSRTSQQETLEAQPQSGGRARARASSRDSRMPQQQRGKSPASSLSPRNQERKLSKFSSAPLLEGTTAQTDADDTTAGGFPDAASFSSSSLPPPPSRSNSPSSPRLQAHPTVKNYFQVSEDPPSQLCCPLTQELMVEPVMAEDGHTYERAAIIRWFYRQSTTPATTPTSRGGTLQCTSPNTGAPLHTRKLVPNFVVKSMCEEYREKQQQNRRNAMAKR